MILASHLCEFPNRLLLRRGVFLCFPRKEVLEAPKRGSSKTLSRKTLVSSAAHPICDSKTLTFSSQVTLKITWISTVNQMLSHFRLSRDKAKWQQVSSVLLSILDDLKVEIWMISILLILISNSSTIFSKPFEECSKCPDNKRSHCHPHSSQFSFLSFFLSLFFFILLLIF